MASRVRFGFAVLGPCFSVFVVVWFAGALCWSQCGSVAALFDVCLVSQQLEALGSLPKQAGGWFGAAFREGSAEFRGGSKAVGDITWADSYFLLLER